MKVCFNSDKYVFRIFTDRAINIAGVYVRKMLGSKKGSLLGYRLWE